MFKVMEKQCDQCLFTKDRIVPAARAKQLLKDCTRDDTHFICHKASLEGKEACCRTFYDTRSTNLIRISQRLGMVKFVTDEQLKAK